MNRSHPLPFAASVLISGLLLCAFLTQSAAARTPVILDSDIGTDIDDTWALAQLLRSPELDLKLVVSDTGDTRYRATILAKFLETSGRTEIPVGIGINQGPMSEKGRNLAPWIKGYELEKYPGKMSEDGIGAMIEAIMKSPEPVTLIAIGPVSNIARALECEPRIAGKCRFVGMHGSFRVGYGGSPAIVAESNVKGDPAALRKVLSAPWLDVLLTPLDTCGTVSLGGED
ncbi:MAG: nucleoside hydrolase, partial [Opitutaceae bacterium]